MKYLPSQLIYFFQNKTMRMNLRKLSKFLAVIAVTITIYSILFHFIMEYEGRQFSWITGFYWTLTVMSTLGFGDITFNANYYYRDDYLIFETSDLIQQDAYGMVNLSARWESVSGNWYGGLHVKNLTDEEYLVGGYDFVTRDEDGNYGPGLGGDTTPIGYYGDPRTGHLTVG